MNLSEFLLARIAEDEAAAKATQRDSSYGWSDTAFTEAVELAEGEGAVKEATRHIERWSPARALAECEAKRRIVSWHDFLVERTDNPALEIRHNELGAVLRALALPYADHPDFDEAWRP